MSTFVTGATGYLGSYVVAGLLERHADRLALLVRAESPEAAARRLWQSLQLHLSFGSFRDALRARIDLYLGDITSPRFGLDDAAWHRLVRTTDSVVHVAATLNRRSERACFDVNLKGTLEVVKLARAAEDLHGLRRFSDVSTTAVAGERAHEIVREDDAIDWARHDYDPYARTKKFAEHMIGELLHDVPVTIFRPSTVIGDSRHAQTTQFDMIRALLALARMRVIPLRPEARHDIVPADWVSRALVELHQKDAPAHRIYHLSAGASSETHAAVMASLRLGGRPVPHLFVPALEGAVGRTASVLSRAPRRFRASRAVARAASLMDVFWPYIVFDTVFDNERAVRELGEAPVPFSQYASALCDFALAHRFQCSHEPWPAGVTLHHAEARPSAAC